MLDAPSVTRAPQAASSRTAVSEPPEAEHFFDTIAVLRRPKPERSYAGTLSLLSLFAFAAAAFHWFSPLEVSLLLGVLVMHEAGHFAAMRAFGYRDVRVFFIPFVGAATSGFKENAPAWQRAVVALMGPVPGLVLAVALLSNAQQAWAVELGLMLLLINGLNLAPFEPLDGGRLVNLILFSRHPRLGAAFGALSTLCLAVISLAVGLYLVALIGLWLFLSAPLRLHASRIAIAFRERSGPALAELPGRIGDASDATLRDLFEEVDRRLTLRPRMLGLRGKKPKPGYYAALMRASYEMAIAPSIGWWAGLITLMTYVAAIGLTLAGVLMAVLRYQ